MVQLFYEVSSNAFALNVKLSVSGTKPSFREHRNITLIFLCRYSINHRYHQ